MAGGGQGSGQGSTCYRISVGFEPDEAASPGDPHGAPGNACVSPASGPQPVRNRPMRAGCLRPPKRAVPKPSSCRPPRLPSGKGRAVPVATRQCTGRPPCRRIRRFRRILPDAPGDLLDWPAALPTRDSGRPLPARPRSGATPSAARGLHEAHWTGSGGHGVEPGPAPMPARGRASRPPECLIADSGFGETSRALTTRAQRQRGVPRVAGRWGRKVALGAGRVLETRG